jgi:hypothetical protein
MHQGLNRRRLPAAGGVADMCMNGETGACLSRKSIPMKRLTATMMNSNLSRTGVTLLLATLCAACASSDGAGASPADGGSMAKGTADGANTAGGNKPDARNTAGGNTADGGNRSDAENTASTLAVNLRTAGDYAILAKSGISTVPTSAITGNLGVSPNAAASITGFSLTADSTNVFSISPQVTGKIFAADYTAPTPSNLTAAIGDMELAFTDAAGRAPNVTELGAGNIGGMTLASGVYNWGTGLLIPTDVTLAGNATDVWIFQVAQDLTMSSATHIFLTGGAMAKNVFWQVAGLVDLGTTAHFEGVILTQTSVALRTGASIKGRLLAQTAVTIDSSAVVEPAP